MTQSTGAVTPEEVKLMQKNSDLKHQLYEAKEQIITEQFYKFLYMLLFYALLIACIYEHLKK